MEFKKVTVVIPCLNEVNYIEKCVLSVIGSDYPEELLSVVVADGGSTDGTIAVLDKMAGNGVNVSHLYNENRTTPYALNLGIKSTDADYVMILGAHSEVDSDYIKACVQILNEKPEVGCVGGLLRNVCADETSSSIAAAMSSPFGVGSAHFRTGAVTGYVDTVAFGMYRKEVFEQIGYFDTDLTRNQDDEFNFRLIKSSSFKIYLTNKVFITYFVRADYKKLWRQYYQYGYWKVLVNKKHGNITTVRQLAPAFWVLGLFTGWIPGVFFVPVFWAYLAVVLIYFTGALSFSFVNRSYKKGITFSFFILHHSYGIGYLKGVLHFIILKRTPSKYASLSSRQDGIKLTILSQYFPPEVGAPQNRLFELAERLRAKGAEIEVITAMPNYPKMEIQEGYKGKWFVRETISEMTVNRCAIFVSKNKSIPVRLLNYFSFVFTSFWIGLFKSKRSDYILCESPPLFLGISAWLLCKFKGSKLIFNVSDLWPESAEKLGLVTNKTFLKLATALEEWLYRKSHLITGQTQGIVANISERFPKKDVFWLPNGVDPTLFTQSVKDPKAWRLTNGFAEDDFILLYAGIIGYAQGLDIILNAAKALESELRVKFVMLGNGPEKERLIELSNTMGLKSVFFMDFVQKKEMPAILSSIDASIVPLRKLDLFLGAIPSKLFECLASEKPILLGVDGEAKTLFIDQGKAGLFFEPENTDQLVEKILDLYRSPELVDTLGKNGRSYVSEYFSRDLIAQKLWNKLQEITK